MERDYNTLFSNMGQRARNASKVLELASSDKKNEALLAIAESLEKRYTDILEANALDMAEADGQIPAIMMDRLALNEARIRQMAEGVRQVTDLTDPIGAILHTDKRPNGLLIKKVAVPLGVIAIIYEARPNVTVDAAALCLKTGNAVILRGGKEAFHSNQMMVQIIRDALRSVDLPEDAVQLVEVTDRSAVSTLLAQRRYIDVVIPRGGAGLIKRIVEESSIPVIETGSGVCHVYVDEQADPDKVVPIIINAKVQRPSVCNSIETILIHSAVADSLVPQIMSALAKDKVKVWGDKTVKALDNTVEVADESNWETEYNDLMLNAKIVDSWEEAVTHINTYGTHHSECIITENQDRALAFMRSIDAAAVYVNASTRFTDGFEFGFGAEIGISTQKLHARGPMGLEALTSYKYFIFGEGQIRK